MDFRKLNHQNLTNILNEAKHEVGYLQSDPDEYIKNAFTAVDKNK